MDFKGLVQEFYDVQKNRIRTMNRCGSKKDGTLQKGSNRDISNFLAERVKTYQEMEAATLKEIKKQLKDFPIYTEFLKGVKGVGPLMAAVIISEYDIEIATTVSKMWKYTGLVPGFDKLEKGKKSPFNKWLKTKMVGVLADSFIKTRSPYRMFYDDYKHRLESLPEDEKERKLAKSKNPINKHKEYAGHIDRMSKRYMIKMFLQHLYVEWRTIAGFQVRAPYAEEYLGKKHKTGQ